MSFEMKSVAREIAEAKQLMSDVRELENAKKEVKGMEDLLEYAQNADVKGLKMDVKDMNRKLEDTKGEIKRMETMYEYNQSDAAHRHMGELRKSVQELQAARKKYEALI